MWIEYYAAECLNDPYCAIADVAVVGTRARTGELDTKLSDFLIDVLPTSCSVGTDWESERSIDCNVFKFLNEAF